MTEKFIMINDGLINRDPSIIPVSSIRSIRIEEPSDMANGWTIRARWGIPSLESSNAGDTFTNDDCVSFHLTKSAAVAELKRLLKRLNHEITT